MNARVVITGLGIVGGLGFHWQDFWRAVTEGQSAIVPWQPEGVQEFPVKYAAPVNRQQFESQFSSELQKMPNMDARTAFGIIAAKQALADAALPSSQESSAAVCVGSGVPERDMADMFLAMTENGPSWQALYAQCEKLNTAMRAGNDHLAALIAKKCQTTGPVLNFSTACAGAAHAIGHAFKMIRRGECQTALAGGADSVLSAMTMTGLHLLGAPSIEEDFGNKLCRPFDRDRSGFVAAEGGAFVVLESLDSALARSATIYAEVLGFGTSMDAYRVTAPHPEGYGAALSMQRTLKDAKLAANKINYINAHGTSTPLNDTTETYAVKSVFAEDEHCYQLAVSSTKSQIGHWIAAAGAPEFIATTLAIKHQIAPPTINIENPDPACDLDYVSGVSRNMPIRYALSNSFGFGGLNACLAIGVYEESQHV